MLEPETRDKMDRAATTRWDGALHIYAIISRSPSALVTRYGGLQNTELPRRLLGQKLWQTKKRSPSSPKASSAGVMTKARK